ncbi:hypothetical protein BN3659_01795 [Alistipes sp. CHKCI003]|nr:hypothetical protein BN3659_01795 [Alistipes sp. CHKCI003]
MMHEPRPDGKDERRHTQPDGRSRTGHRNSRDGMRPTGKTGDQHKQPAGKGAVERIRRNRNHPKTGGGNPEKTAAEKIGRSSRSRNGRLSAGGGPFRSDDGCKTPLSENNEAGGRERIRQAETGVSAGRKRSAGRTTAAAFRLADPPHHKTGL